MTSCGDWLNSTPAETKVEPFGLSLWSQRKTNPKSQITHYAAADCAVARCLSVRLSVTRRYCVETVKHVIKLFSPSGSHTVLVFPHHMTIFRQASSLTAASNARAVK